MKFQMWELFSGSPGSLKIDTPCRRKASTSSLDFKREQHLNLCPIFSLQEILTIKQNLDLIECDIWSTMMYGCETWTISEAMKKQREAAEMWFLQWMMKISWTNKVTNENVLRRVQTGRQLMKKIVKRQCSFLGHVLRTRTRKKRYTKTKTDIS